MLINLRHMAKEKSATPMMAQYRRIKNELPKDALLLFRLGDFYEMFFEDAQVCASLLNLSLTKRGTTPMCGVPFHAAKGYISRLLKAGRKIALCDQVEDARPGILVKREVTQILSPGTHFDERILNEEKNNYLAATCQHRDQIGLAFLDLTTGDFRAAELKSETELISELERVRPAEVILPEQAQTLLEGLREHGYSAVAHEGWSFESETARDTLRKHFQVVSLDGFGLKDRPAATGAAGGILHYLTQHLRRDVSHLHRLACYEPGNYLVLDAISLRNLEILEPIQRDSPRNACLLGVMNRTVTPMGARHLRNWLTQPLSAVNTIRKRQAAVASWLAQPTLLEAFRDSLGEVSDLERILSRLSMSSGNGRDMHALRKGLDQLPRLRDTLATLDHSRLESSPTLLAETASPASELLKDLRDQLTPLPDLVALILKAITEEPPLTVKEGGLIRTGYDTALDELHAAASQGKEWIAQLQQSESENTGIPSLKVRYNSVFGYYIEVTRTHLNKVPPQYIRKQTISNGERYITPELKEMEGKILGAEERGNQLEYELFLRLREAVIAELPVIQQSAAALADLDVIASMAETARIHDYCRPEIDDRGRIDIRDGRHPVLDQRLTDERFIPNDTRLDQEEQQIAVITGPNMAGKSTYIRQVALLTLLAHTGSFIPAASAIIDRVDRIFTRIGASDDLVGGQSTFMVEMSETANILNHATQRSLIILDEIGRGTSTFDGLSLAWSIVEFLHHQVGAKSLFATHYHELTELAARLPRVANYNVAVREWNDQIIFLRKIVAGGTDKSYGLQVARLAGVPKTVIKRAQQILCNLEETNLAPLGESRGRSTQRAEREKLKTLSAPPQLDLFGTLIAEEKSNG